MDIFESPLSIILADNYVIVTLKFTPAWKLSLLHFTLGLYIRNQYLWNNEKLLKELSEYYKTTCVDTISRLIIEDIYYIVNNK